MGESYLSDCPGKAVLTLGNGNERKQCHRIQFHYPMLYYQECIYISQNENPNGSV